MDSSVISVGPLTNDGILLGALLWALALYLPLSRPLRQLQNLLERNDLNERWQDIILLISSF